MVLAAQHCEPCSGDATPLVLEEIHPLLKKLKGWNVTGDGKMIVREFKFSNFQLAQAFAVQIGDIAERENHHPDIAFGWGYCTVALSTHSINGLHQNDFIIAAKIDAIAIV